MTAAGLVDVAVMDYSQTTTGGTDGCLLHRNLNEQAEPLLLASAQRRTNSPATAS